MPRTLLTLLATALLLAAAAGRDGVAPARSIDYAGDGHERQRLDVYPAEGGGDGEGNPAVVFVHGGAFRAGDRAVAATFAERFTERGVTVVSVGYRLRPEVAWPANVGDVAAGLAFVLDHADTLRIDPDRVTLMGHSAGAHLAACVAADPRWLGEHGRSPAELHAAVVIDYARYDAVAEAASDDRGRRRYVRRAFGDDPADHLSATPAAHAEAGAVCPRWLGVLAGERGEETAAPTRELFDALAAAGAGTGVVVGEGEDHRDALRSLGAADDAELAAVLALVLGE